MYAHDYEGRRRECDHCGHFTNVHTYCYTCEMNICEGCQDDHTCIEHKQAESVPVTSAAADFLRAFPTGRPRFRGTFGSHFTASRRSF